MGPPMFEVVELDLSGQWHTPTLGEIAELLVFYDRVDLKAPLMRIYDLLPDDPSDMAFLRTLIEEGRVTLALDQLPLGEVAHELGLIDWIGPTNPEGVRDVFRSAYPTVRPPPSRMRGRSDEVSGKAWINDWERIMARTYDPYQTVEDYPERLIDHAAKRMPLIAEPQFLAAALEAFGDGEPVDMRKALASVRAYGAGFEGRDLVGLKIDGRYGGSQMLEFISQADALLTAVESPSLDTYTGPDFDRWTRRLVAGSAKKAGVREDLDAFRISVAARSSVATAIDTGTRRFQDIEELIEAREPLAKVVRNRPTDQTITEAYFEAVTNQSWINSGLGKVVRFSFFSGLGVVTGALLTPVVGAAVGISLNGLDSFVLDKIIKGNACSTFVNEKLKPFASQA
ncbi:hypothetical protein EIB18_09480 [Caulobacter vibrioides]|uniref:Uncharacterized protein n=2 Tax=Caulobacter vibrioides TaxID=155892 RepID=Q9A7E0_CAUVC|nr:hypothetical protein [Caulobacter vibrioides]YP_002517234.1 hypothetical protein CCNA_01861 [Caulobacter vibrioides NA1000]AAK23759.1 hypothetical protein CC_1783 [Caulobacter vibrioides CB15]ACL95326.1 hypothetical protein CCNA_01861 [Caulobacter vibrioides NA1000]ATC28662.1 hypothetical protein CA607_09825 [Caulobacter vibrioides]AZH12918.1 hypothetical protein EIB18_09480 [Caulobacter vibrioides]QXZ53844.1 hypothetical protein KZH45_09305 [Caulobacter vibrioides]